MNTFFYIPHNSFHIQNQVAKINERLFRVFRVFRGQGFRTTENSEHTEFVCNIKYERLSRVFRVFRDKCFRTTENTGQIIVSNININGFSVCSASSVVNDSEP